MGAEKVRQEIQQFLDKVDQPRPSHDIIQQWQEKLEQEMEPLYAEFLAGDGTGNATLQRTESALILQSLLATWPSHPSFVCSSACL